MRRSKFDESQDQRIADESEPDRKMMCGANGCPNLWSTSDVHLCRWHAAAPAHRWPEVTRDMHDHITDQALSFCNDKPVSSPLSREEKSAILECLRTVFTGPKDPLEWVCALEAKKASGERLSPTQKHALEHIHLIER